MEGGGGGGGGGGRLHPPPPPPQVNKMRDMYNYYLGLCLSKVSGKKKKLMSMQRHHCMNLTSLNMKRGMQICMETRIGVLT